MSKKLFKTAIEEINNSAVSSTEKEQEIVLYGQITDFTGLQKADSKESHEQWEIRPEGNSLGRFRIRKTAAPELPVTYVFTIKIKNDSNIKNDNQETNVTVDEAAFNALKIVSEKGMIKDRYCFKSKNITITDGNTEKVIPDSEVVWEVDCFPDGHGGYHPWCKIDLETGPLIKALTEAGITSTDIKIKVNPKKLPINLINVIQDNDETKDMIRKLYDDYFLAKK